MCSVWVILTKMDRALELIHFYEHDYVMMGHSMNQHRDESSLTSAENKGTNFLLFRRLQRSHYLDIVAVHISRLEAHIVLIWTLLFKRY